MADTGLKKFWRLGGISALLGTLAIAATNQACVASRNAGSGEHCEVPEDCDDGWTCLSNRCAQLCNLTRDCSAPGEACQEGLCAALSEPECESHDACAARASPCDNPGSGWCEGGKCYFEPLPMGTPCDDQNLCTDDDVCDATARCVGSTNPCDTPPDDACVDNNTTFVTHQSPGQCDPTTGECSYPQFESACDDCSAACLAPCEALSCDDTQGGCILSSYCVGGTPAYCEQTLAPDLTSCTLSGPPSTTGLCSQGMCVDCFDETQCTDFPGDPQCYVATCQSAGCTYDVQPDLECAVQTCESGLQTNARLCGTEGDCADAGTVDCGGFQCDGAGVGCLTACADSNDCQLGYYCDANNLCTLTLDDGALCGPEGSISCASGYCDGTRCCAAGDCCEVEADCPAFYTDASVCGDQSTTTDCQGTRSDPVCTGHVCSSTIAGDDSGCDGLVHVCPNNFASVLCSDDPDQAVPQCRTTCSNDGDCAAGYRCEAPNCVLLSGTGEACTGAGQGTCDVGLRCQNNVCCDENGPICCTDSGQCAGNLACDLGISSCYDACNDYDSALCVNPTDQFCLADACLNKQSNGVACGDDNACLSGFCVEGLCCDAACGATCESCSATLTGSTDGTCAFIQAGNTDLAPSLLCTAAGDGCPGSGCACDGTGTCLLGVGQSCSTGSECFTGLCECADSQCSTQKCAVALCGVCEFTTNGSNCVNGLGAPGPIDDPEDCLGADSCYGGTCLGTPGAACSDDNQCGLGHCECADADCTTRVCAADDCICGYGAGGTCTNNLTDNTEDPQDCDGANACYAGMCLKQEGETCAANSGCGSDHCECTDADCTVRVCATDDCICGYGTGGACTNNLTDGTTDPEDCEGANACVSGVCQLDGPCTGCNAPVAEYKLNEASSGQGPTALLDSQPTPVDLALNYVGSSPVWSNGSGGGDHLRFDGTSGTDTGGAAAPYLGTKFDPFHGSRTATVEAVYSVDHCVGWHPRLFGLSSGNTAGDNWLMIREYGSGAAASEGFAVSFNTSSATWYQVLGACLTNRTVVHWVVDTDQGTDTDRIRAYFDGVRQTVTSSGSLPPSGSTVDLGTTSQVLLGRPISGTRTARARIWYGAMYLEALTDTQISERVTILQSNDD